MSNEIRELTEVTRQLRDEELNAVVGGTTFRVDAETEPSVIVIRNHNGTGDYPVHTHGGSAMA